MSGRSSEMLLSSRNNFLIAREQATSTSIFNEEDAQECANITPRHICNEISYIISGAKIPVQRTALEVCASLFLNKMVFFGGKAMVYPSSEAAF